MKIELHWHEPLTGAPAGYQIGVTIGTVDKPITYFAGPLTTAVIHIHIESKVNHVFWARPFDNAGNLGPKENILNAYSY